MSSSSCTTRDDFSVRHLPLPVQHTILKERPINLLCSLCPWWQETIFLPFDNPIANAVRAAVGMKPRAGRAHSGRVTDCWDDSPI